MAPISIPRKLLKLIDRVSAINWNRLEDEKDLEVWDRLTGNLTETSTWHVFTGLDPGTTRR